MAYIVIPFISQAATKLRPLKSSISRITSKAINRVGINVRHEDNGLVQWAQEDISLLTGDTMVNGAGAYDRHDLDVERWDEAGLDEYIPLTINPKYGNGRRIRSYGATPDIEMFAERGLMKNLRKYFSK